MSAGPAPDPGIAFGRLPLLPGEREYGTLGAHATCFAFAVATWCFMIGGYAAQLVGAVQGTAALIAGHVIGAFLTTLAPGLACQRYGLEQVDYCRTAFGQRGSRIILIFYIVNQLGWNGLILVMFGNGIRNILSGLGIDAGGWVVGAGVALGLGLTYLLVTRGVHMLNVSNAYIAPALAVLTVLMLVLLLRGHGWAAIAAAPALRPLGDPRLNYLIVFEWGVASGISWWGGIGFLARNTGTRRNAIYPEVLQLGLGMGLVCCVSLFSSLVVRTDDPTEWMLPIGGPLLGALALVFVTLANVSTSAVQIFTAGLALRHLGTFRHRPWRHLVAWSIVPLLPFVIWPGELYSMGNVYLAYNGTVYAPIAGVLLADFLIVRRRRLDLWSVYDDHPSGSYHFTRGFNLPAFACLVLGQAIYFFLFNPLALSARPLFKITTATLPACIVPAVVYAVWMALRDRSGRRFPGLPTPAPLFSPGPGAARPEEFADVPGARRLRRPNI